MAEDYTYPPVQLPGNELAYTVHVIERTQLRPGDLLVLTTRVVLLDGGLTIHGIIGAQDGREQ